MDYKVLLYYLGGNKHIAPTNKMGTMNKFLLRPNPPPASVDLLPIYLSTFFP